MCRFERWAFGDGNRRRVTILDRHHCDEEVCPECGRGIRVTIAKAPDIGQVFRLECLFCHWTTNALPDPERREDV